MAVVTLIGLVVGVSTLNMQGLSDEGRLRAGADQLAAAYRLAVVEAERSGRPHVLVLAARGCGIRRAALRDGEWVWETGASFALPGRVTVTRVGERDQPDDGATWEMPVAPGDYGASVRAELATRSGGKMSVRIDARGATVAPQGGE